MILKNIKYDLNPFYRINFLFKYLFNPEFRFFYKHGYLYLKNFFTNDEVDQINNLTSSLILKRKNLNPKIAVDINLNKIDERRISFSKAPDNVFKIPFKLNDLYLECSKIREFILQPKLQQKLSRLMGYDPVICNSLSFSHGSQQVLHLDTFYMPPRTFNQMVASWIALEDVNDSNGPLIYYPNSHKIKPYVFSDNTSIMKPDEYKAFIKYMNKEIKRKGLKPQRLFVNKGDVFIWHSFLFHGGSEIKNKKLSRKSLVTHYFSTKDCKNYAEETSKIKYIQRDHQSF